MALGPRPCAASPCSDLADFPESRFQPSREKRAEYLATVARGTAAMRRQRVVIAGLARNVAWVLERTMARIERLGSMFADYRVVIYENDSEDATLEMLQNWSRANGRVVIRSECRNDPINYPIRCLGRAERMAYYRNQYKAVIGQRYRDYDAAIIVDTDLAGGWSYEGIAHTFGLSNWDYMGSYGILYKRIGLQTNRVLHFDSWAFRFAGDYQPLTNRIVNNMHWSRGDAIVPVGSCFGGLGVYRLPGFLASSYDGEDAEHVGLHRRMSQLGYNRLFLNPSQVTLYGRRHRKLDGVIQWWQRMAAVSRVRPLATWY